MAAACLAGTAAATWRTQVERLVMGVLLAASLVAILTTMGVVASLRQRNAGHIRWQ